MSGISNLKSKNEGHYSNDDVKANTVQKFLIPTIAKEIKMKEKYSVVLNISDKSRISKPAVICMAA